MYMNGTHRNTCTIHAGYMQDTWDTYLIGKYTKTYRKPHVTPMKRGDVPPHVWAARLVTGVDGLQATQKAVLNMKMSNLTPRAMRTIEMDKHRRGSVAKRVPSLSRYLDPYPILLHGVSVSQ